MAEESYRIEDWHPGLRYNVGLLWPSLSIPAIAKRLSDHYGRPVSHKQVWNARPLDSGED